jgi:murein DD-endopeptidase MepM/ murein hydrolase activator NlpD
LYSNKQAAEVNMGCLNDFAAGQTDMPPKKKRRYPRFARQIFITGIIVLCLWFFKDSAGPLGEYARYIRNDGLAVSGGWLPPNQAATTAAGIKQEAFFIPPLGGTAVRDFSGAERILIQGMPGENVKAAQDGAVNKISRENNAYSVYIDHGKGYSAVYANLTEVSVRGGERVKQGDALGTGGAEPIYFSLFIDGTPADALDYIYGRNRAYL